MAVSLHRIWLHLSQDLLNMATFFLLTELILKPALKTIPEPQICSFFFLHWFANVMDLYIWI